MTTTSTNSETGGQPDAIFLLSRNIVDTDYEDIPAQAIAAAKKSILDTLGALAAGSGIYGCQQIVDHVKDQGGKEESSILVYGGKVPTESAVLANTTMARAHDIDDCHDTNIVHLSVGVVPTALAMAERQGGATGKELITAVVLGTDLIARLAIANRRIAEDYGRAVSFIMGTFGAAAATGKMLGLDVDTMVNALGIAYSQAAGNVLVFREYSFPYVSQGLAAKAGVLSALLAKRGLLAGRNVLQSQWGYYRVYENEDYDPEELTSQLGERFEGANVSYKSYPVIKHAHATIEAVLDLVHQYDIIPEDVDEIVVRAGKVALRPSRPMGSIETEFNPQTPWRTSSGLQKLVGIAVVKRKLFIDDFRGDALKDRDTLTRIAEVARKVKVVPDLELSRRYTRETGPITVEIRIKNGKMVSKCVDYPKGHPRNPMTMDDIADKFRRCFAFAAKPLPKQNAEEIIDAVSELERVDDVQRITRLLI